MDILTQAKQFATQRHVLDNRQLYGNILPYTHHLQDVEKLICDYGFFIGGGAPKHLRAAAWLHDVVEDTRGRPNEVRVRDIEELFGEDVAFLVSAVTSEEGANRKIRNALTYPKIRAAGHEAVMLKLADRIANVSCGGRLLDMYKKEHADFRHGIYISKVGDSLDYIRDMQDYLDYLLGWQDGR